jgi:branched-subunit amino acid aminotransferase/4-amino-4-deoxychorismate lyase
MSMIWCNDEWLPQENAVVDLADRGLLHGLGAFETMLAVNGLLQHQERHRQRMQHAVDRLGLPAISQLDLSAIVAELCAKNHCLEGQARVRWTLTAGRGPLDQSSSVDGKIFVQAQTFAPSADRPHLITLPWRRNEQSPLVGLKCASYAENLLALRYARAQGADEGLFFNTRDELCEACMGNVFLKMEGEIFTPSLASGCLPGVMRAVILDAAREQGISIKETTIMRSQLVAAEQIFLSSALRGIVPAQSLDQRLLSAVPFPVLLS